MLRRDLRGFENLGGLYPSNIQCRASSIEQTPDWRRVKRVFIYILTSFLLLGGRGFLLAQEQPLPKILQDLPQDTVQVAADSLLKPFRLPHTFLIPNSEKIYLKILPEGKLSPRLLPNLDYRIDYRQGEVQLLRELPTAGTLLIIYRKYPFPLIADYYHRELQEIAPEDTAASQKGEITARAMKPKFLEEIDSYQANLQKSGSIVRGIEIGNNQDLTLNSGLNLQLSGKITPEVELVAALTDQSTPIQPEGTTQSLQEVDKVFVKITSPYLGGTLGDYNLIYGQSLFGNLQRKLQGITVENSFKATRQQATYGTSRGIFHSTRFLAREGFQGPYLLTGRNGEREIIVLAGTERVYVDGVQQVRGQNNDYIIDYGLAQITFTNKRLITSENRIEVDFEYTSVFQRYGRNLIGLSSAAPDLANRVSYDVRFFREWDDTNNLLEDNTPLEDFEKAALAAAGDDPLKAAVSGATLDSLAGDYMQADTLVIAGNDTVRVYYKYVGPGNGDYRVRFSGVGAGNGQYLRERLGVFRFVGPGRGDYLPVRLIPLAGEKKFLDLAVGVNISRNWSVRGEFAGSEFDQNVFSSLDDENNRGGALLLASTLQDTSLRWLGTKLGRLRLEARWVRQEETFAPLDRPLQPEYAYKWNLGPANLSNRENSLEVFGAYQPGKYLRLEGNAGSLEKGLGISSWRQSGKMQIFQKSFWPEIGLGLERVHSRSEFDRGDWLRQNAVVSKDIGKLTPRYGYKSEDRRIERAADGRVTGFVFRDHRAGLDLRRLLAIDWQLDYQQRSDFLYDPQVPGRTLKQAATRTYSVQGALAPEKNLRGQFSFAFRDKDYSDFFEQLPADSAALYQPDAQFQDTTWQDRQSHIANIELQHRTPEGSLTTRWDYKIASELQALLEQRYLEVGENRGNFRFDSTLNEYVPDPQGNFILVNIPTNDFESVIRLETGLQLQYRPGQPKKKLGDVSAFFNRLSFISYLKIEEQSRTQDFWDVYLLNIGRLHNPASTLRGAYIVNQDLYYNERNPNWGVLARLRYRDNLSNQYLDAANNETRIIAERLLEYRRRFFNRKLNASAGYQNNLTKRQVSSAPSRNLNILSQALITRLNWRPGINWQFELAAERGWEKDRNELAPLGVNFWNLGPQISYALRGRARATANLTFLQVEAAENPANRPIPFEMGKGKKPGNSWLWGARFEYFISGNITISANYSGRRDATAIRTLHLGKAEVRAFF